jgi:hypothetical protein
LRAAWAAGDKIGALRIALRFSDRSLETRAFQRAWDAHSNRDFYRQLGREPEAASAARGRGTRRLGRDPGRSAHRPHLQTLGGVPDDRPWMWTITEAVVAPHLQSHGFCAVLNEAKAEFAETWRAWLARHSR